MVNMLRVIVLLLVEFQCRYYLLYLLLRSCVTAADISCFRQQDCNDGHRVRCGVCVDDPATPPKGKCLFPFSLLYLADKTCQRVRDCKDVVDKSHFCHGRGMCQLTTTYDTFPYCECHPGFHGWQCESQAPQELATVLFRYVEFPYKNVKAPVEILTEPIRFFCGSKRESSVSLGVVSEDGGYILSTSFSRDDCKRKEWIVKEWFLITRFPYIPPTNDNAGKILNLGNKVLGYMSSFSIKITVQGTINYHHSFPVFVSYDKVNLKCVPVITLAGCSSTKNHPLIIKRWYNVWIESHVYFIDDGSLVSSSKQEPDCADQATYKWRIWKNEDNDTDGKGVKYYNKRELDFKPFHLEIGQYRILLEVVSWQEEQSVNYAYCYVEVKFEPLVAIIDGGSARVVQQYLGVLLTTTRSKDPNMPTHDQGHVMASWSCVDISSNNLEVCDPSQTHPVANSYFVPPEKLNFGAELDVILKVWTDHYETCETCGSVQPAFASAKIFVTNQTFGGDDDFYLQCLNNCESKVVGNEQLYLKAKTRSGVYTKNYTWTYFERGLGKEEGVENIAVPGLPSFMLVVKQNSFSAGKTYTVLVQVKGENLTAQYTFETVEMAFGGNCSMDPMMGTRGLTKFNILCENFENSGGPLTFEFYDKTAKEAQKGQEFGGRLLGSSTNGELRDFRVTGGQVFVYIKDDSGLYKHKQFNVNLSNWTLSEQVVEEIFHNMTKSKEERDFAKMIEYTSIVPDVVPNEFNKSQILEKLLPFVECFPMNTLAEVKIASSTLKNVILKLNKPVNLVVEPGLMNTVVKIIQSQVKMFSSIVHTSTGSTGMTSGETIQWAASYFACLLAILKCKDPRHFAVDEFDLDIETEDQLMHISDSAVEIIYYIQNVLTFSLSPGLPPIKIPPEDNIYNVWVVKNDEDYNLTNYLNDDNVVPVSVSNEFIKEFERSVDKRQGNLVICVATLNNIYWWRKSEVKTDLVSVSLKHSSQDNSLSNIRFVRNPLDVQISVNPSLVNTTEISDITFKYQYNQRCSVDLDLAVKIHRLDPAPRSLITLRFLYPQTNGSLKVLVYRNHRPECDMMRKAFEVSQQFPNYASVLVDSDEPSFYYIGIIPGPNNTSDTVKYTFQVNTTVCRHWVRGHWSTQGCKISKTKTKYLKVHCYCDQFSMFAAAFPVPPQEVDPFSEINLFMTVFDNSVVVIFVSAVLLLYIIACLWAYCKDRNDRAMRNVIILRDNFPGDRYPYLVAVYTSSRFNAGTTANVGMKIIGSLATSRSHILASSERKTLRRNYDDWFLMFYSEPLGELKNIHVWHDNAGSSPDWFCDKIVVYDLKDNVDAVFVVEQWLALRLNCYPEANVSAATLSQVKNLKRLFLDNWVLGLREDHSLLSVAFRHPRSVMSRLQKISVLTCYVMVAMLCSIMFYSPKIDASGYEFGMRDFIISVQSMMISFAATFFVIVAFKKSNKYTFPRHRSATSYKASVIQEYDALQNIRNKNTLYARYVRFVARRLKRPPMLPVHMTHSKRVVEKRRVCFAIAWISCIAVIVVCSFFVMLYGLKLGLNKSKMWMTAVLFTVGEELFIIGPIKILIYSFLLSVAFQKTTEISTHRVSMEDARKVKHPVEEEQYEKLSAKRNHPMYAPLRSEAIDEMIRKKKLREKWHSVIDFIISLCFIAVLSIVMQELWRAHYHTNTHAKNMVTQHHHPKIGAVHFSAIRNISQMEKYLELTLIRALYVNSWYNRDPIREKDLKRGYWLADFTHRTIGFESLRQIRVMPKSCSIRIFAEKRRCIPSWDSDHEDTHDYSERWGIAKYQDLQKDLSPWKYTKRSSSLESVYSKHRMYGESGTLYHSGGYITYLGPLRSTTEVRITDTITNHWQDQLTSAVFVEFTLYNVNRHFFSHVTLIVEYLISGKIELRTEVTSMRSDIKLSVCNVLLALLLVYYVAHSCDLINRQGLMEFLASSLNRTQVAVIVFGILSYALAISHYFTSTAKYNDFIKSGYNSCFGFDSFVWYYLMLKHVLPILFCLAVLRSVLILHQGTTFVNYLYTLKIVTSCVVHLSVTIILFLLLQFHWMFLLYIYSPHCMEEVILNPKYFTSGPHDDLKTRVFFLVKTVIVTFLLTFYFVIFKHSFRIARTRKVKKIYQLDFFTFISDTVCRRNKT